MTRNNSHISEVSMAKKNAMERDTGNIDIAAAAESLAAGGMDSERDSEAGVAGQCDFLARAICAT
jgi:hypothetical protein